MLDYRNHRGKHGKMYLNGQLFLEVTTEGCDKVHSYDFNEFKGGLPSDEMFKNNTAIADKETYWDSILANGGECVVDVDESYLKTDNEQRYVGPPCCEKRPIKKVIHPLFK